REVSPPGEPGRDAHPQGAHREVLVAFVRGRGGGERRRPAVRVGHAEVRAGESGSTGMRRRRPEARGKEHPMRQRKQNYITLSCDGEVVPQRGAAAPAPESADVAYRLSRMVEEA